MLAEKQQAFFKYINERESIRQRKLAGASWPWTEDPILQTYKFTNVYRELDATSVSIISTRYERMKTSPRAQILLNCALSRYFGTAEFAESVGVVSFDKWPAEKERIREIAEDRRSRKERVFTGAYVVTNGGISAPKQDVVLDYYIQDLVDNMQTVISAALTGSWEATTRELMKCQGFGGSGFMAKETLVDTTYTNFWGKESTDLERPTILSIPEDWGSYTPMGPGARRGVARIFGHDDIDSPEAKSLGRDVLRGQIVISHLMGDSDKKFNGDGVLFAHDIQFALCEFDKYERVRLGQGTPRSKYRRPT